MPDLGLEVLLKGSNMLRLLQGLWVALRISLIAVVISIPLGLLFGVLMTRKKVVLKAIFRVYLEFIRIMPQLVLLFLFYFSTTRTFGWNLSGETASIIVFVLWGTAEMSDLRYIEARLSKFALDVVFNPKTTDWQLSYDGRKIGRASCRERV